MPDYFSREKIMPNLLANLIANVRWNWWTNGMLLGLVLWQFHNFLSFWPAVFWSSIAAFCCYSVSRYREYQIVKEYLIEKNRIIAGAIAKIKIETDIIGEEDERGKTDNSHEEGS
jgi:hypothetical protein